MKNFNLAVDLHPDTAQLDEVVLRWAFSRKLIQSYDELEKYRREKVNFFAGYLFSQSSKVQLEWIMKMFLWLFLLDDRLDKERMSYSKNFIWALISNKNPTYAPPFSHLFQSLMELQASSPGLEKPEWQVDWNTHWKTFLNGLQWELNNKSIRRIPQLSEYKYYRPHLSGVYLALHFLKLEVEFVPTCASDLLEFKIARWICLGNDLISEGKEIEVGDFHNELFLLSQLVSRKEAKTSLEKEIQTLFRHIQELETELLAQSPDLQGWIYRLNLLMGGCVYWSNDVTVRYETYLNGVAKP